MSRLVVPKWVELVIAVYNAPERGTYYQKLTQRADITSSYIRTLLLALEASGLIRRRPRKNIQYIELTEKGKEIAEMLMRIKQEVR